MHICYKTNSQNPIKIYSSKKSLTVDPNTELDCSDFDINETIFVRSVFLKKEKRNIFGWFALFFGKLFVNICISWWWRKKPLCKCRSRLWRLSCCMWMSIRRRSLGT